MDTIKKNRIYTAIALALIIAASSAAHFYRISYPASPAFDEAHFATYAADYFKHKAFFDIHPPLGKLFYAAALVFSSPTIFQTDTFITIKYDKEIDTILEGHDTSAFNDFPYVPLRGLSAIFGILLPLVFYFFLRKVGVQNIGALLGAVLVALENAMLVETRLILMNGFCLVFALLGLAAYFGRPRRPVIAGVLFGLALAVKLSAVVFLGVAIAAYFLEKLRKSRNILPNVIRGKATPEILRAPYNNKLSTWRAERRSLVRFAATGFLVLALFLPFNLAFFSTKDRLAVLESEFGFQYGKPLVQSSLGSKLTALFGSSLMESTVAVGSYVAGMSHELQSPWYLWLAKEIPMTYYADTGGPGKNGVTLDGNPIVWYASTLAVIFLIAYLFRYLKNFKAGDNDVWAPLVLFGGYFAALLPFITIVRRSTFLYHYFPALLFAIGILVWFLSRVLNLEDFNSLTKKKAAVLAIIVIAVIAGFLLKAPLTYGL